ncbi:erythroblast NAD(P)(+)--arginine ADP-ribosyltransferase-like [Chamaea fasciata]|uniref:erythroblast NAD(P)(+)--arginine ADP-ribosyltransferase-like n=1 Tax=Chamaea fasciata TaxID=190680 RepID=UPI00336A6765
MARLAHTLALLAMTMATAAIEMVPLDMALDSFDDQYQGCAPGMTAALSVLNRFEFQKNPLFAQVWVKAKAEWRKRGSRVSPLSSPDQAIAVMAYTMPDVHMEFNAAVRVAGHSPQEYRDNFHFKMFHFLLTHALVTLRHAQNAQCHHVFRGVRDIHFKVRRGQRVRFGQFTSTSLSSKIALQFGTATIFQVHTCHGVDIQQFSNYPWEEEVLIPPFETFEVTQVTRDRWRTWIWLRSTGTFSKYNCEWLQGEIEGGEVSLRVRELREFRARPAEALVAPGGRGRCDDPPAAAGGAVGRARGARNDGSWAEMGGAGSETPELRLQTREVSAGRGCGLLE